MNQFAIMLNRARTMTIPFPLLGFGPDAFEKKRAIELTNNLSIVKTKLNRATVRSFDAVSETVSKLLHVDADTSDLQNEILKQSSYLYLQRRLTEACQQLPNGDIFAITQNLSYDSPQITRNTQIMNEFIRVTEPKKQLGIDLMTESLSQEAPFVGINSQGPATLIIDAVANFISVIGSQSEINMMIVESKKRRQIVALEEKIEKQIEIFISGQNINMGQLVKDTENLYLIKGDSLFFAVEDRAEIKGRELANAFHIPGTSLINSLHSVLRHGAAQYFEPTVQLGIDNDPLIDEVNAFAKNSSMPDFFEKPSPIAEDSLKVKFFQDLAPALSSTTSVMFMNSLTSLERVRLNLQNLGHNLDPRKPGGRRNLLGILLVLSLVLSSCTSQPDTGLSKPDNSTSTPVSPLMTNTNIAPEVALLSSLAGRPDLQVLGSLDMLTFEQKDIAYQMLSSNTESVLKGLPLAQQEAIKQGLAIGFSRCSDCRPVEQSFAPLLVDGEVLPPPQGVLLDSAAIGTQPTIYKGVNQSFFLPHTTCANVPDGCGALGGIKTILSSENGEAYLRAKGISQMTIDELKSLISLGATDDPVQWALRGAQVQAELNLAENGTNHFVAFGTYGHADGTLQILGVIDSYGQVYSIDDFPLLKGYAEVLNAPHPIDTALAAGQAPKMNALNGSKTFSNQALLSRMSGEPGVVFRVGTDFTPGTPLTPLEARNMIASGDFSLAHLQQRGNVITLIADNVEDMNVLRSTLLTDGLESATLGKFLEEGGAIFEVIPDPSGKFAQLTINKAADVTLEIRKLNLLKTGLITKTVSADEFLAIMRAQRDEGLLTANQLKQLTRWEKFSASARPVISQLSFVLQVAGNVILAVQAGEIVDQTLLGHALVYEYYVDPGSDFFDKNLLLSDQLYNQIAQATGANPYFINGFVKEVKIPQKLFADEYFGVVTAWMDRGPGMANEASPWKDIPSVTDLGKALTLKFTFPNGTQESTILVTSLAIKPGLDKSGAQVFIKNSFNDNNQPMMLLNEQTGEFIMMDSNESMQFLAIDPNTPGIGYIMEVTPNQESGTFDFSFVTSVILGQ